MVSFLGDCVIPFSCGVISFVSGVWYAAFVFFLCCIVFPKISFGVIPLLGSVFLLGLLHFWSSLKVLFLSAGPLISIDAFGRSLTFYLVISRYCIFVFFHRYPRFFLKVILQSTWVYFSCVCFLQDSFHVSFYFIDSFCFLSLLYCFSAFPLELSHC